MKLGWLWDSILKMAASPSPMSITPAFSPGPWITQGALVGSFFRWARVDLYEQCSLHITLKMPSSTKVGSRPIRVRMRSYSASESPCSRTMSGVILVMPLYSGKGFDQAFEQLAAVGAAERIVHHPFGVGHQAQHIAFLAQNAGDVAGRAVGVLAPGIAEGDAVLALQAVQCLFIREI